MSKASLAHHYDDPKDALIVPHKFMALTHYYVDRWLPELGERGHVIVTVLRRMGYLDRERDVERGGIEIEQEELAALCGLKLRTLQREFASGEDGRPINSALHRFVQREQQYHRNGAGRVVREKTVYVVQMRDPLHPSDQAAFQEECDQRQKNSGKNSEDLRSRQSGGNGPSRSRQSGGEARQDGARSRQSDRPARQSGGNNKVIPDSYILELPLDDAGGAPGVSPAASSGGEGAAPVVTFAQLSDAQRQPYLDQAQQELMAIHAGTGITPKPKLIEARARNLYQINKKETSDG